MARRDSDREFDDDAPWLAEATPAARTDVSRRSLFWTIFVVLALATVVTIGLMLLMARKEGGSTEGYMNAEQAPVITAEPGPYKIKPADPAGMDIEGVDGAMYNAGEGIDAGSAIDPSLAPEQPLPRPGTIAGPPRDLIPETAADAAPVAPVPVPPVATAPPAAAPAMAPAPAKPAPVARAAPAKPAPKPLATAPETPAIKPAAKSGSVQLGAFSSEEKANAVWAGLAGKHGLSGKRVIAVESGGRTLYRLRAASADPAATCARLKAAGDACAIVE